MSISFEFQLLAVASVTQLEVSMREKWPVQAFSQNVKQSVVCAMFNYGEVPVMTSELLNTDKNAICPYEAVEHGVIHNIYSG